MPSIESSIEGSGKLLAIFGRWPSFHDAEVIELDILPGPAAIDTKKYQAPSLVAKLHTWEMTSEVDASGHYVLKNHTLVTIHLVDVEEFKMEGFNHQNVIFGLSIVQLDQTESTSPAFHVVWDPSFDVDATFKCSPIAIVEATAVC